VVKMLLGREEVNPDNVNKYPEILLLVAPEGGKAEVVKCYSSEEVNPEKPDNRGRTPYWWASWFGNTPNTTQFNHILPKLLS